MDFWTRTVERRHNAVGSLVSVSEAVRTALDEHLIEWVLRTPLLVEEVFDSLPDVLFYIKDADGRSLLLSNSATIGDYTGVELQSLTIPAVAMGSPVPVYVVAPSTLIATFVAAGLYHRQTLGYLLAAVPIAGVGLYVGGRIQTGLSQRAFQLVIRVLLLTSGLALLLKP